MVETQEQLDSLKAALTAVIESEDVGRECESANWHSLQDNLAEIRDDLHIHDYSGTKHDYGDAYEIECVVKGCLYSDYVEVDV